MDALTEAELSHEIYLNKLSSYYANQWDDIQPDVINAIRLAFSEFDNIDTLAQQNELNERIDELLTPILEGFIDEQNKAIEELAESEAQFQNDIFQSAMIGALTADVIAKLALLSRKKYRTNLAVIGQDGSAVDINKKLNSYPKATIEQIKSIIKGGYTDGQNINDVRTNITGTKLQKFNDGYIATANRNIKSIIKTARKHMETQVKVNMYKKLGADGYILDVTLDSGTSDICLGWLHYPPVLWADKFKPLPPFHYRCRTVLIPYIKGVTIRPEKGFTWLKEQSKKFQDDLIGPTRAKIFRDSGLTVEEFRKATRNNINEPITLKEMERKNKQIKEYLSKNAQGV